MRYPVHPATAIHGEQSMPGGIGEEVPCPGSPSPSIYCRAISMFSVASSSAIMSPDTSIVTLWIVPVNANGDG